MMDRIHDPRDDSGIALLVVLGAVALMVVLATGAFYFTSQTLFDTQMADRHDAAFQAASSGLTVAFTDIRANLATHPSGGSWTGSVAASSAVYAAEARLDPAGTAYECTSTGTASDGTREVVVARFEISATSGSSLPWGNNVFYFGGYTGGNITGNGTFEGPLYLYFPAGVVGSLKFGSAAGGINSGPVVVENGNLDLKGLPSSPVNIYTNGTVTPSNRPEFVVMPLDATFRMPITVIDIPSYLSTSLTHATTQSSDNLMGDVNVPNYEAAPSGNAGTYSALATNPPNNRPAGWVRSKAAGAGQAYKVIAGGLTIDYNTVSWGSWSGDGHYPTSGDLHDDFAYDAANGVLYIDGTVYIDGDLTINKAITYVGNGTLVCTGNVRLGANVLPATTDGNPDGRHLLGLFAGGTLTLTSNGVHLTGASYTPHTVVINANNCRLRGSFIAEQGLGSMGNGTDIEALPLIGSIVPPGLPTWGSAGTSTLGLAMTGWRRL